MSSDEPSIGRRYLQETRYRREGLGERGPAYPAVPRFKEYPQASQRLVLDPAPGPAAADLWACLRERRSLRQYRERALSLEELTALVWAAQGVTLAGHPHLLRTAPSAGALYPVETYLAVHRVTGVDPGIWHLHIPDFALELLNPGDCRRALVEACLSQNFLGAGAVVFIWTGILNRAMSKYRERAIRYLFLDAGHICQNLMLAATALGLGCCPVGAFFDEEVEQLTQVDGQEEVALYLAAVGAVEGR
ncbi:MAG: SagB/ThcOx family dehydrogenase [Deltaproteobacteria bacterium]|nr:SagB/ThcOx family dehydrogenase [Deltaproteobacteria bacterium]MBI4794617.1 SagB/ThcOx family dehydrogenase [Deltaproteobacteria bacterium]